MLKQSKLKLIFSVYFPQFTKLLPKKSKRCKACKKFIVQVEDYSKKVNQKFELCHLFINQLPYCSVNKVDFESKTVFLKFSMFEYKEAKISFTESPNCKWYMCIPDKKYEISDINLESSEFQITSFGDPFVASKTDRCVILKFKWLEMKDVNSKKNIDINDDKNNDEDNEINKKIDEEMDEIVWSDILKTNDIENENISKKNNSEMGLSNIKNNGENEKIVIRFITTAEYLRLDYHQVSYEYEITIGK